MPLDRRHCVLWARGATRTLPRRPAVLCVSASLRHFVTAVGVASVAAGAVAVIAILARVGLDRSVTTALTERAAGSTFAIAAVVDAVVACLIEQAVDVAVAAVRRRLAARRAGRCFAVG